MTKRKTIVSARSPRQIAKQRAKQEPSMAFVVQALYLSELAKARGEAYAEGFAAGREDARLAAEPLDPSSQIPRLEQVGIMRRKGKKKPLITIIDRYDQVLVWKKNKGEEFRWHKLAGATSSTPSGSGGSTGGGTPPKTT